MRLEGIRVIARRILVTLVAGAAALISVPASAQPRSEKEVSREAMLPVTEPTAMAEWVKRLSGRFRFDGMVQVGDCAPTSEAEGGPPPPPTDLCQGAKGKSDCIGVGEGPGVQCILNVEWQEIISRDQETGETKVMLPSYLDPAMELFGLDPGKAAINRMNVNNKGLPEGGLGSIRGNTATFRMHCVNGAANCYHIIRIEAKPEAKLVYWWLSEQLEPEAERTFGVLSLRRVTREEESAPTLKPASRR